MAPNFKKAAVLAVMMVLALVAGAAVAVETQTVVGIVTDGFQIEAEDGSVYDIADSEKGTELLAQVGKKVMAKGTVVIEGDYKTLTIESFTVLGE